ncbi:hypothetical protein B0H13DRAFT_1867025 [Mycena leptocephala]|nr:hypothetical protein B0H13DRAFT_1867025 [Mycena leptocephala]
MYPMAGAKWKFDRPGNAQKKLLANATAFDQSLKDRHKDYVFSVYMPLPYPVKKTVISLPVVLQVAWQNIRPSIVASEASKSEERMLFKYWAILMQRARKDVNEDKVKY